VTFRNAVAEDWPAIGELLMACALPLDGAREHVDDFVLAFLGAELVGSAAVERYAAVGLLRSVAVRLDVRATGLGQQLVRRSIARARQRGIRRLVLLTTTAAGYFRRFGFQAIERSAAPVEIQASAELSGACPSSAVVMQLDLSSTPW
jgi:amino-acid N-acetyltransferase